MHKWDARWFSTAQFFSQWSKDTTKVGAIVVTEDYFDLLTHGYNGVPHGVNDLPERYVRPEKYSWIEHAERNALNKAARRGVSLKNGILYTTLYPCVECARSIIQVGIKRIVTPYPDSDNHPTYKNQWDIVNQLFFESKMIVSFCQD